MLGPSEGAWFYEEDNGFHCGYNATDGTPGVGAGDWVDCPVMQFSGLRDSHGVDIYEGDKVYLAGYGVYDVRFPFTELYDAAGEGDVGGIVGCVHVAHEKDVY